ncbi:hypothetical protein [Achromobacter spanius]|uniref:Uncharacterized protein n=1 Tax=Achromobacter spanius TaxID=217203 RepID=A0AAW3I528_9BURK|nr:hypothetical protein [Achromobacter spanius]KNE27045.1 hypothetical protein AFM18_14300 [Achromobacter spanius]
MTEQRHELLTRLGFRFGINGPHAARTMMLDDLRALMAHTQPQASKADYTSAVVDSNVLGKPTRKSRELALRYMAALYALDLGNPIFRALRHLWALDESAQPMLALAVALARDPLLRSTQAFVLNKSPGTPLARETVEAFLDAAYPDRFSPASLKSFSQNLAGTWTAAGLLHGHVRKLRSLPEPRPETAAMLLFLGFLEGRTGQRLFTSEWTSLLCISPEEFESLASAASHRGLLVFMNAGGVKEVRFPGYVTADEEQIRQEVAHVI